MSNRIFRTGRWYSRIHTLLDPASLRRIIAQVESLGQNLSIFERRQRLLNKLEGVFIWKINGLLGENPLSGGGLRHTAVDK